MKEIPIQHVIDTEDSLFIDVRSPSEFREGNIPGSINLPIFSDEERAEVGTTYKVQGQDPAKWLGMQLVSPKIPKILEEIGSHAKTGKKPIIYCWRGGMRSKAITTFAEMSGLEVKRLTGGFRSYRHWVIENLNEKLLPDRFIVLHGMTGVGKTLVLDQLKENGFPTLDLEKCAGHRGSVFGGIGNQVHNQKTFESILLHQLKKIQDLSYAFMEAESKRIGKSIQPDFLLKAKKRGVHIILETTHEIRVERIFDEYVKPHAPQEQFQERVMEAITPILKRFSTQVKDDILEVLERKDYKKLIGILLMNYYDPRYQHKLEEYEGSFHTIKVDRIDEAVTEIMDFTSRLQNPKYTK
jgi:tRNA 2-selenouridine synthase